MRRKFGGYYYLSSVMLFFFSFGLFNPIQAQTCNAPSGCSSTYTDQRFGFTPNQPVEVTSPNANSTEQAGITSAMNGLNSASGPLGNNSGVNFYSSAPGSSATVTITFNTTVTNPPCQVAGKGPPLACNSLQFQGSTVIGQTITIYLAVGGPNGWNTSAPNFSQGVANVVTHELSHGLGMGDCTSNCAGSTMADGSGENDSNGASAPSNCDDQEVKDQNQRRATGSQCSP